MTSFIITIKSEDGDTCGHQIPLQREDGAASFNSPLSPVMGKASKSLLPGFVGYLASQRRAEKVLQIGAHATRRRLGSSLLPAML